MYRLIEVLICFFLSISVFCIVFTQGRGIHVNLTAAWNSSILYPILETSEFLADENEQLFWKFVDNLQNLDESIEVESVTSSGAIKALSIKLAKDILPSSSGLDKVLNLSLATRTYAARVELFNQLAQESIQMVCPGNTKVWGILYEIPECAKMVFCTIQELLVYMDGKVSIDEETCRLTGSKDYEMSFDHIYPSTSQYPNATMIVYGTIGSKAFGEFHEKMKETVSIQKNLRYILRHFPPSFNQEKTFLQGYGVALDIKNMEYKTIDDDTKISSVEGEEEDDEENNDDDDDEDVDGFFFSTLFKRKPELLEDLKKFRKSLLENHKEEEEVDQIKAWDIQDIGNIAVQDIMRSSNALKRMQTLCEDFPKHAKKLSLSKKKLPLRMIQEIKSNREVIKKLNLQNRVLFNGILIDPTQDTFNAFDVLQKIRQELSMISQFISMGLKEESFPIIIEMCSLLPNYKMDDLRIDVRSSSSSRYSIPDYINDIEKDKRTRGWSRSIEDLRNEQWGLAMIRKNMYEIILILDPTTLEGRQGIQNILFLYEKNAPLRYGLLFINENLLLNNNNIMNNNDESYEANTKISTWQLIKIMGLINDKFTLEKKIKFLNALAFIEEKEITQKKILDTFTKTMGSKSKSLVMNVLNGQKDYNEYAQEMVLYIQRKGLPLNCYLFNGKMRDGFDIQSNLMDDFQRDQEKYKALVQQDILDDDHEDNKNVYQKFLNHQETYPTFLSFMKENQKQNSPLFQPYLILPNHYPNSNSNPDNYPNPYYFYSPLIEKNVKHQTIWLMIDFNTKHGIIAAMNLLEFMQKDQHAKKVRSAILPFHTHNHNNNMIMKIKIISSLLQHVQQLKNEQAIEIMLSIFKMALLESNEILFEQQVEKFLFEKKTIEEEWKILQTWKDKLEMNYQEILLSTQKIQEIFKIYVHKKSHGMIFINGMMIEIHPDEIWSMESFQTLKKFDSFHRQEIVNKLKLKAFPSHYNDNVDDEKESNFLMILSSLLGRYHSISSKRMNSLSIEKQIQTTSSGFSLSSSSFLQVYAYLDPLSEASQRIVSFLSMLYEELNVSLHIRLIPQEDYDEFPLKRFYRFVFHSNANGAIFLRLPLKPIFTMKIETDEAWNVQVFKTEHDLDNLRVDVDNLIEIKGTKYAEYQLKSLLVQGQCMDITSLYLPPPNGLQLILEKGQVNYPLLFQHRDTLVMRNFGYFQMQVKPGIWTLSLAQGRARKLYEIVDDNDADTDDNQHHQQQHQEREKKIDIIVNDFTSTPQILQVKKRKGKEDEKLLDQINSQEDQENHDEDTHHKDKISSGVWSSFQSFFNPSSSSSSSSSSSFTTNNNNNITKREGERIHVFSLASGHLYERFLKIMMLSVTKRTHNPVTFWLLENFLSPSFKQSIPALAQELGIEIRLVTYKWPIWLRQQTVKQRIIWGYKILFLDVLFPLDVHKIIYVDADQVVRADLKELWEMDLHGKPYAYTPFCSSRKETLGFQFWRSGFWESHLRGLPYHISALYVVDLLRFRRIAAGDLLRATYDNLSRDPASLANLDQDLPNFAQHQLPIHSLPQEWLWCESWCSDKSKEKAKTIDLCNNPLHKEPKLEMAKRIISGKLFPENWLDLDQEIKQAEERYQKKNNQKNLSFSSS